MDSWSQGHSTARTCRTCSQPADLKPPTGCTEERHHHRYDTKRKTNNDYRRARRAAARAAGTVERSGRGNPDNKKRRERERHRAVREVLHDRLGQHVCATCGYADKRALQFDHIDGGGRQHRLSLPSGGAYYKALLSMTDEALRAAFQVLCANCNAIKREEHEEWRWTRAGEAAAA